MINLLWLVLIVTGIVTAAFTGKMAEVSQAIFDGAVDTVDLLIKLLGPMALWLGLMRIARDSGLTDLLARVIKPLFAFVFPEIPENHPASGSILLNLTANMLGLGNSATPLGIKAMQDLQELNQNHKERASISMCTLLALNTSSITLVPATIISLRVAAGSQNPALILITTFFATSISTITALLLDKVFRYFSGERS